MSATGVLHVNFGLMLCIAPWPPTVAHCQMAFTLLREEGANQWSLEEMKLLSI